MVDEDLISRAKKNDKSAFKALYENYAEKIYKTAYMLINDKGYAQDIVQEVFIKVYVNINSLKHNSAFNFRKLFYCRMAGNSSYFSNAVYFTCGYNKYT